MERTQTQPAWANFFTGEKALKKLFVRLREWQEVGARESLVRCPSLKSNDGGAFTFSRFAFGRSACLLKTASARSLPASVENR